jgi:hypothetical protein
VDFHVHDFSGVLDEKSGAFMDTAAVMKNLDLVISIDTSIAHLAGALGVPAWIALTSFSDWRWFLDREDSPWYPTLRLFRQKHFGRWQDVFARMTKALANLVGQKRPASAAVAITVPAASPARKPVLDEMSGAVPQSTAGRIVVPVAAGELIDKITILEIKNERIRDPAKVKNIRAELAELAAVRDRGVELSPQLGWLSAELKRVNELLWQVEEDIRACEREGDFGGEFVELARSVYKHNDRRSALKRQINELVGSRLMEEKSYAEYRQDVAGTEPSAT